MTMEILVEMKFREAKRMLDKKASYFWEDRNGLYALVNSFTLKTAIGIPTRLDAMKLQKTLIEAGYNIQKLVDFGE